MRRLAAASEMTGRDSAGVGDDRDVAAERASLTSLLGGLPPEWSEDLLPWIAATTASRHETIIVVDDDPTGTQTVRDARVLLQIDATTLVSALATGDRLVFLLTNSRSLPSEAAGRLARRVGRSVATAQKDGRSVVLISRGDSTLRGHFPVEVEALAEGLGQSFDATLLVPALIEAGRLTIGDVQYVVEATEAIPVSQTAYARDPVFGFESSNLRDWVQEKTDGRVLASEVASISLNDLRSGGPALAYERLLALEPRSVCIVNAATDRDLEVLTAGLLMAEAAGRRFSLRSAASFVRVRSGRSRPPLLAASELPIAGTPGGLIVVGSHVPRSTAQLAELLTLPSVVGIELDVRSLGRGSPNAVIRRIAERAEGGLSRGDDVVVYTSRAVVADQSGEGLAAGRKIANVLADVVGAIRVRPSFVVTKGGITSSVVALRGLRAPSAWVTGQILPGVPVWRLDQGCRYPDLVFVVFPGNVGDEGSLREVVLAMRSARARHAEQPRLG
jgi:uncharacterized protein YgbK (DUF1537 family)